MLIARSQTVRIAVLLQAVSESDSARGVGINCLVALEREAWRNEIAAVLLQTVLLRAISTLLLQTVTVLIARSL